MSASRSRIPVPVLTLKCVLVFAGQPALQDTTADCGILPSSGCPES